MHLDTQVTIRFKNYILLLQTDSIRFRTIRFDLTVNIQDSKSPSIVALWHWQKKQQQNHVSMYLFLDMDQKKSG